MSGTAGGVVGGSLARYDPFGGYRTKPATTVNPDISDRGFTGHKQNNTGSNDAAGRPTPISALAAMAG